MAGGLTDSVRWRWDLQGNFTIRSACWSQTNTSQGLSYIQDTYGGIWKKLWKTRIMERQRLFGWLLLHDRVLTSVHLAQRGLVVQTTCKICKMHEETSLHLFRDCTSINKLWRALVPEKYHRQFFQVPFMEWMCSNIDQVSGV